MFYPRYEALSQEVNPWQLATKLAGPLAMRPSVCAGTATYVSYVNKREARLDQEHAANEQKLAKEFRRKVAAKVTGEVATWIAGSKK